MASAEPPVDLGFVDTCDDPRLLHPVCSTNVALTIAVLACEMAGAPPAALELSNPQCKLIRSLFHRRPFFHRRLGVNRRGWHRTVILRPIPRQSFVGSVGVP